MIELIFLIVLVLSLVGIGVILFRKIPVLVELSETSKEVLPPLRQVLRERVKSFPGLKSFSYELYLQKILSRIRVLTLKTENKTSRWLEHLRQKSNQKNNHNNDNYWEELKKAKDGK